MLLFLEVLMGFGMGYLLVTLAESILHQHVHHAHRWFREWQRKYPLALRAFRDAYRSHAIVHHRWTYRDHVTQFLDDQQKNRIDERLQDEAGRRIIAENYGTTLNLHSAAMFMAPILPFAVPALLLLPWPAAVAFCVPLVIYPLMSRVIHPYLHQPYQDALNNAHGAVRWALSTSYMRYLWRHHWLHHQYPQWNFNLVLGGDWLRGAHRVPSEEDRQRMREIGLPVD
jgi:hypothetical protein